MKKSITGFLIALSLVSLIIGLPFNTSYNKPMAEYVLAPPLVESATTPELSPTTASVAGTEGTLGSIRVITLLVEFRNLNHTVSHDKMKDFCLDRVSGFYREASNGRAWIVGDVAGWYKLDQTVSYYGRDGRMVDDPNFDGGIDSWWLIRDAVEAADPYVDFAEYDHVVVVHAGYGQESSRVADDIWSVAYWGGLWIKTNDAKSVRGGAIAPEMEDRGADPFGVICHELAHLIGLPDLYGQGGSKNWVDRWGLMDRGLWNGNPPGSSPAHPVAWCTMRLGWIPDDKVIQVNASMKMNLTLTYLNAGTGEYEAIKIPINTYQYYLVEAKGWIGYEESLPDEGVIIYLIDDKLKYGDGRISIKDADDETDSLDDAIYHPGDSYVDIDHSIRIDVLSKQGDKYTLSIDRSGPAPDIAIKELFFEPTAVQENDTITINAKVANEGALAANRFKVNLYINDQLYKIFTLSLKPGGTETIQADWVAESGLNTIIFALDRSTVDGDANPDNDELAAELPVGYSIIVEVPYNLTVKVDGVEHNPGEQGKVEISVLEGDITLELEKTVPLDEGVRAAFSGWDDGDDSNPRTLTISRDMILEAIFQKEYRVEVDPKGGSIEGAGWYLEGSDADIKASNPSVLSDGKHRLAFKSWSGDSNATTPTLKLPVYKPLRLEASWSDQYYLSINSPFGPVSGSGWYEDQDVASFSIDKPVVEEEETRLIFEGWRGDFATSAHNGALTMDGPKQVEAVWRVEHRLTVESIYGEASGSGWYLEGETTQINIAPVVDHGDGTKHVFKKWKGDIESLKPLTQIEVDSPKYVEAEWSTMYLVTLGVMGVSPNSKLNITVNGEDKTVNASEPLEMWIDAGETLILNATNIVPARYGYHTLDRWVNGTGAQVDPVLVVDEPVTVSAVYKAGIGCLIATATYGSELTPQVSFLRAFRDRQIMESSSGRSFMIAFNAWYYSFSPGVALWINENGWVKPFLRGALTPLLSALTVTAYIHQAFNTYPEAAAVLAGIAASALIGIAYLSPPLAVAYITLNRKTRRLNGWLKTLTLVFGLGLFGSIVAIAVGETISNGLLLSASTASLTLTGLGAGTLTPLLAVSRVRRRLRRARAIRFTRRR